MQGFFRGENKRFLIVFLIIGAFSVNRSENGAKKRATPPHQQAGEERFLSPKDTINKRKTASSEAVPLLADKTNCTGGVDRARTYDLHDVNVAL